MPDIWELTALVAQSLLYIGILTAAGLAFARAVFRNATAGLHARIVRLATSFALLALLACTAGFSLKGAALTGAASGMVDLGMLGLLWQTQAGSVLALQVSGLAIILAGLRGSERGILVAVLGGALALSSFPIAGHIADSGRGWLQLVLLLHVVCASFWIGILAPLRILAADKGSLLQAAQLGHQFGQIAMFTVPALIAAGVVMALFLVGEPRDLIATGYGLALLGKVCTVGVLLAAAAANKLRFVPAMRRGESAAAAAFRRSIAAEWVAIILILLATSILTTLPGMMTGPT